MTSSSSAAAYFFQREFDGEASVLVLDNHDDFGGHARRNEFAGSDRMTYAGSQGFDNIDGWTDVMWDLLEELGIDFDRFENTYQRSWFERHGLGGAVYLDGKTYGRDHLIKADLGDLHTVMPGLSRGSTDYGELFAATPLPESAREELTELYAETRGFAVADRLDEDDPEPDDLPYEEFLRKYWVVSDPATFDFLRKLPTDENGVGTDVVSLTEAVLSGLPGTREVARAFNIGEERDPEDPGYIHHFPDGNAGFCRAVVRALVPGVAPGGNMDDLVKARFDYSALDDEDNDTRIRLSSTVIEVTHEGAADSAEKVAVTYMRDGKPHRVRAKAVVLACWNMVIPYICRELPEAQKEALAYNVKIPYVFSNVLLKNWQALKDAGIGAAYCPSSYHHIFLSEFPVKLGGYEVTEDPQGPMPVTLVHVPLADERGMAPKDQFRAGRYALLATEFEEIEAEVHAHLDGMLGPFGFSSKRDIGGLTVNRWSHGYAYSYFTLFDKGMTPANGPHLAARKRYGRIAIANSDAGADSWLDIGVAQGYRAVGELIDAFGD